MLLKLVLLFSAAASLVASSPKDLEGHQRYQRNAREHLLLRNFDVVNANVSRARVL
jgi:hypothetical protein